MQANAPLGARFLICKMGPAVISRHHNISRAPHAVPPPPPVSRGSAQAARGGAARGSQSWGGVFLFPTRARASPLWTWGCRFGFTQSGWMGNNAGVPKARGMEAKAEPWQPPCTTLLPLGGPLPEQPCHCSHRHRHVLDPPGCFLSGHGAPTLQTQTQGQGQAL